MGGQLGPEQPMIPVPAWASRGPIAPGQRFCTRTVSDHAEQDGDGDDRHHEAGHGRAGARTSAQPLRVGPGFIRAGMHATGQGLGEHERGGSLEYAAEQIGGAGYLEAQGPPVLATQVDLGEFHLAPGLVA